MDELGFGMLHHLAPTVNLCYNSTTGRTLPHQSRIATERTGDMDYINSSNWHEAANMFPLIAEQELTELAADINNNGLQNPIVLFEGKVLDGRNRLLACKQSGTNPTFINWTPNGLSPVLWVISQNLKRRHLDASQKAAIAVEAKPLLAAEAKKNQSTSGPGVYGGKSQTASIISDIPGSKPLESVQKSVANQFSVSEGYVYAAQKIKDKDESVFQEVKAGTLSIPDAQKKLNMKQTTKALGMSESNEWYTPAEYVEAARQVMGGIDLDPASNDLANEKVVKAKKYYTQEDDGLTKDWSGRVWLNPPYARIVPKFADKLVKEYESGKVKQAILLVNPRTDTVWFQQLFNYTLCFTNRRLKFWKPDEFGNPPAAGEEGTTGTCGSVFIYLGPNRAKFAEVFSQFGSVVELTSVTCALSQAA